MFVYSGRILLLAGFNLFGLRFLFVPVRLRRHVPNDRQLRFWSDVVGFGLPAGFAVFVGLCLLSNHLVLSLLGAAILFGLHVVGCHQIPWTDESDE